MAECPRAAVFMQRTLLMPFSKSPPTRAHVLDVKPAIQLFTRDDDCRRLIVTSSGLMSALIAPLLYSEQRCSVHNNRLTRACIQSGLMTVRVVHHR